MLQMQSCLLVAPLRWEHHFETEWVSKLVASGAALRPAKE
jgi:hypothetical protein